MKTYLVLQYLLRKTDENHVASAYNITDYLDACGITSERRSIYRDIEEINKANLILEEDCDIEEAEKMLADDEDDELKLVVYDKSQKGFYVRQRHFELDDIRLLAECVYTAKFVSENKSKQLLDVICEFVSEHQAEKIRHGAFLTDRTKTNNKNVLRNIAIINDAMSTKLDGFPHTPEKITFKYTKYSIDDVRSQVERRHGARYTVSPFQLLINDGNYYLLAFDDAKREMRTYSVDRMKELQYTNIPREGEEAFKEIDLRTYTQRAFSMFSGNEERVTLRFINPLLDAVIERFGTTDAVYSKCDKDHFTITTKVQVSEQFFGWLLGFGKRVQLVSPPEVQEKFVAYLDKVREMY